MNSKPTVKQIYNEMLFQYKDTTRAIEETVYYRLAGFYQKLTEEEKQYCRDLVKQNI